MKLENNLTPLRSPDRRLDLYSSAGYDPGAGFVKRLLWYYTSLMFFESGWMPVGRLKVILLRCFGSHIGCGVVIKPNVRIKYPWHLSVGDHVWIGQEVWIDNLAQVTLDAHSVLSQGVYLCTGSHDHRKPTFDLVIRPISIRSGAWVCARATILGGVTIGNHAVVGAGAVVGRDVPRQGKVRLALEILE